MAEQDESLDRGLEGRTELRVHGVSGTTPETILAFPILKRVAGDERAGFYRRWYPGGRSADFGEQGRLEAYSWGGLTSGPAARAAWLLVLPLMLVNLAHWMLPAMPVDPSRRQLLAGHVSAVLLRLLGLVLTLTMLHAAIRGGMKRVADALAAERLAHKPESPWARTLSRRAQAIAS